MSPGRAKAVRIIRRALLVVLLAPAALTLCYRLIPPPGTPLMLIRAAQGHGLHKDWRPLDRISPHLRRAVLFSEDGKFCTHWGFDWTAIRHAVTSYADGGRLLGASTISMQTTKNLFLWPGRDFLRKGLEAVLTPGVEALLPKRRILELYLNVVEFGPGLYGAEAAAQHYFQKSADRLTRWEGAALAAQLPDPLDRDPRKPGPGLALRILHIAGGADDIRLGADGACGG